MSNWCVQENANGDSHSACIQGTLWGITNHTRLIIWLWHSVSILSNTASTKWGQLTKWGNVTKWRSKWTSRFPGVTPQPHCSCCCSQQKWLIMICTSHAHTHTHQQWWHSNIVLYTACIHRHKASNPHHFLPPPNCIITKLSNKFSQTDYQNYQKYDQVWTLHFKYRVCLSFFQLFQCELAIACQ